MHATCMGQPSAASRLVAVTASRNNTKQPACATAIRIVRSTKKMLQLVRIRGPRSATLTRGLL
eukprot:4876833-Prymnesium_polylepis.1